MIVCAEFITPQQRGYTGPSIPLSWRELRDMKPKPLPPSARLMHLTTGPFAPFTLCGRNAGQRYPNLRPGQATCPRCLRVAATMTPESREKITHLSPLAIIAGVIVMAMFITLIVVIAVAVSHVGSTAP